MTSIIWHQRNFDLFKPLDKQKSNLMQFYSTQNRESNSVTVYFIYWLNSRWRKFLFLNSVLVITFQHWITVKCKFPFLHQLKNHKTWIYYKSQSFNGKICWINYHHSQKTSWSILKINKVTTFRYKCCY